MKQDIERAQKSVADLSSKVNPRFFPKFHISAEAGWINDPNGLIYFNGVYHVFFQHHPYSAVWGPMHWGHVTSQDMIHWKREPIALAPSSTGPDKDGCFSGSAVIDDFGQLALVYTGHTWLAEVGNNDVIREVQCLAYSQDGINFEKYGVVLEPPEGIVQFRDPKVWKQDGIWYMVLGAQPKDKIGEIWLYSSKTLKEWIFESVLYKSKDPNAYMLECPDFFPLGDKWMLMFSPQGMKAKGYQYRNFEWQAVYLVGNWSPKQPFQVTQELEEFDLGHDFYAPQTFLAPDNRRILVGWANCPNTIMPTQKSDNWCCQHATFRELSLDKNDSLCVQPIKEIALLRANNFNFSELTLNNEEKVFDLDCNACEINVTLDLKQSNAERFGMQLAVTPNGNRTWLYFDNQSNRLVLDRYQSGLGGKGYRTIPLPKDVSSIDLRVFIDKCLIEVFVSGCKYTLTSTIYPLSEERKIILFADNALGRFLNFNFWQMDSMFNA